jgi:hypothetical protein
VRKNLEHERGAVTGGRRGLRNEGLHDLCSGTNIMGVVTWRGYEMGMSCGTCRVEEKYVEGFGGET